MWLDYTNFIDTWQNQVNWAAGLNSLGVLTYNLDPGVTVSWTGDWRLPITVQPDPSCSATDSNGQNYGYNCTGSEMGHLYYTELGHQAGDLNINTGPFNNLYFEYWTGTFYAPDTSLVWAFFFNEGGGFSGWQYTYFKDVVDPFDYLQALAVRPGDVSIGSGGPSPVPEPATIFLPGSGLAGLAGLRRRLKYRIQ